MNDFKKAQCANCGKELEQEHSDNWKLYCNESECQKAFMSDVLKKSTPKREIVK